MMTPTAVDRFVTQLQSLHTTGQQREMRMQCKQVRTREGEMEQVSDGVCDMKFETGLCLAASSFNKHLAVDLRGPPFIQLAPWQH